MYAHLWTSPELDYLFEERGRLGQWLRILRALAGAQAELAIIPSSAAEALATVSAQDLDLDLIAAETRATSHSTLGLIRGLERLLAPADYQYAYYGVTVQDVSDTWFAIVMRDTGDLVAAHVRAIAASLLELAQQHRDTLMVGRTHGQPGAPITFGTKAASWAEELARHLERLEAGRSRWSTAQLGGAVGVLGFFGAAGAQLRARFCAALDLADPGISWLTSRDRVAEFGQVLAMVCATLGRIGAEVYELQRPEIGELREPRATGGVSSITMPHKRNPESAEHLVTLARLVRAQAGVLLEGMDQQHERDGRGWKAEWIALPEVCELTMVAVNLAESLLTGLEVDTEAMAHNLAAGGLLVHSEQVLAGLSVKLGKHAAQQVLQEVLSAASATGPALADQLAQYGVTAAELDDWLTRPATGIAGEQVDFALRRAGR
jgi:adenylosuccinate lyase